MKLDGATLRGGRHADTQATANAKVYWHAKVCHMHQSDAAPICLRNTLCLLLFVSMITTRSNHGFNWHRVPVLVPLHLRRRRWDSNRHCLW